MVDVLCSLVETTVTISHLLSFQVLIWQKVYFYDKVHVEDRSHTQQQNVLTSSSEGCQNEM